MPGGFRMLEPMVPDRWPDELRGGIVAIGNFDGVHRGHAALIGQVREEAAARGVPSLVLTFEPHPRSFFKPDDPVFRLTPVRARARLFAALGVDGLAVATFDAALAGLTADDFIERVLVGQLGIAGAVVGFNFHFGRRRGGTPRTLAEAGGELGFVVRIVGPVGVDGDTFTSSSVRAALTAGDVASANRTLGYRWFAGGEVVQGQRRGRGLGFPTANMALWPDCGLRHGIYAVLFRRADGSEHRGIANYGRRPTFDNGAPLLETHLLDFDGDLYGETAEVVFVDWVRPEAKFASVDDLVAAMNADAAAARRLFDEAPPPGALDRALTANTG